MPSLFYLVLAESWFGPSAGFDVVKVPRAHGIDRSDATAVYGRQRHRVQLGDLEIQIRENPDVIRAHVWFKFAHGKGLRATLESF